MDRRLAFLTGGIAVGLAALWRAVARRPRRAEQPEADPRAAELRQRLDEARTLVDEREEFEAAETSVDQATPVEPRDPEQRRREVHAEARSAAERMRSSGGSN